MKMYKNIVAALVLGLVPNLAHCWTHTITNETPLSIDVTVDIVAGPNKKETIPAGKEGKVSIDVGAYCVRAIRVFAPAMLFKLGSTANSPVVEVTNVSADDYNIQGGCGLVKQGQSKSRNYVVKAVATQATQVQQSTKVPRSARFLCRLVIEEIKETK